MSIVIALDKTMPLIPFETARTTILNCARPLRAVEDVELAHAFGRILASDMTAPVSVPPFANASMDGYALRAEDLPCAGTRLPISQYLRAGDIGSPLLPGTAARIFTGASMPEGSDAVVMQEDCAEDGQSVVVRTVAKVGQYVRLAGMDIRQGTRILHAGSQLTAAGLGLAASVGIGSVQVFRRLKVAIFSTGSELTEPGQRLTDGHIYNSNRYVMRGFLSDLGAEIIDLGIIRDDRQAIRKALRTAASRADVVIASGGMSVGDADHVTAALRDEGRIDFWKVAVKPGKPLAFGAIRTHVGETAFIGVPGNPVALWVGFVTLVVPFLRVCQGFSQAEPPHQKRVAAFQYETIGNRVEFVRVRTNGLGTLEMFPNQDSAVLSSAAWADGLAMIPPQTKIAPGDAVEYWPGPQLRP